MFCILRHPVCIVLLNLTYPSYSIVWLYGWNLLFVVCGCMVEVSFIILCGCMVEVPCCIVWLYGWSILIVLCGCMVEVSWLYCVGVWLQYPDCIVWVYGWNILIALCGCMVEVSWMYCVAVWLKYPDCIVWLYGWSILIVLCGCMVEVSWLYCVAVWLKYPVCIVWVYVLRYLDFRAQTMYRNRVVFLCEASHAIVGIAGYSGLCLFLHPFQLSSNYSLSYFSLDTHNSLSWCHVSQVHRTGNEGLCKYGVTVLFLYPNFTAQCW